MPIGMIIVLVLCALTFGSDLMNDIFSHKERMAELNQNKADKQTNK